MCIVTDNLTRVTHNLDLSLNGRYWIIQIVINGWTQENTTFEAIMDYTPADHIYEDRALNVVVRMETTRSHKIDRSLA
jgi:hypothetical protein